jgi:chaperonin GroEL
VTVRKTTTELTAYDEEPRWKALELRASQLRHRASVTSSAADADRWLEEAAALTGGLCRVKVGGYSEAEAQDRRARAEDVLHSVRAALKGGCVPGAGQALYWASLALPGTEGAAVLRRALEAPRRLLARGPCPECTGDPWLGYDPLQGRVRNLGEAPGVYDACEVVVGALEAAVSTAVALIPTGALVSLSNG